MRVPKGTHLLLTALVVIPLSSACASSTARSESGATSVAAVQGFNESTGTLIPITSDNVAFAGYDSNRRVMTVTFHSGSTYEYYEVPASLWERFVAAQPHPWSQVGYPELVQGGYGYQKISE